MKETYKTVFPEVEFGGFTRVDTTVLFYNRIRALINEKMVVLDLGCGRASAVVNDPNDYRSKLRNLRGLCSKVIGLDVDNRASDNPTLDEFILMSDTKTLPLPDESIDLIFCDFVLEHIEDPVLFRSEISRVLKPGGYFCARTTNKLGYVAIGARIIPETLHKILLQYLQPFRASEDIFPTFYRLNTKKALNDILISEKWDKVVWTAEGEQSYFSSNKYLFILISYLMKVCPSNFRNSLILLSKKVS